MREITALAAIERLLRRASGSEHSRDEHERPEFASLPLHAVASLTRRVVPAARVNARHSVAVERDPRRDHASTRFPPGRRSPGPYRERRPWSQSNQQMWYRRL